MGASGIDVQLSESARGFFPYAVECKNRASIAIYRDFEQATGNAREAGLETLLVIKENHAEPLAVITLDHFMELCERKQSTKN